MSAILDFSLSEIEVEGCLIIISSHTFESSNNYKENLFSDNKASIKDSSLKLHQSDK